MQQYYRANNYKAPSQHIDIKRRLLALCVKTVICIYDHILLKHLAKAKNGKRITCFTKRSKKAPPGLEPRSRESEPRVITIYTMAPQQQLAKFKIHKELIIDFGRQVE